MTAETRIVLSVPRRRRYGANEHTSAFESVRDALESAEIGATITQQSKRQAQLERSADTLQAADAALQLAGGQ